MFHLFTWTLGLILTSEEEMVHFPGDILCGAVAETRAPGAAHGEPRDLPESEMSSQ